MNQLVQSDLESAARTLQRYGELEWEHMEEMFSKAHVVNVRKGELLVLQGDVSDEMFLVVEGAIRSFSIYGDKEYSDWFALPDQFVCSITSYFTGGPSQHSYEVIVPGRLLKWRKADVDELLDKSRAFERVYREVVVESMLFSCSQLISTRYMTAEERYTSITEQYPELLQMVPLKHLASYLCISPETLSRIRARTMGLKA